MVGGGGVESDYSVCPQPLLQFLQFRSVMLCQCTLEGQDDVECNNKTDIRQRFKKFSGGGWVVAEIKYSVPRPFLRPREA